MALQSSFNRRTALLGALTSLFSPCVLVNCACADSIALRNKGIAAGEIVDTKDSGSVVIKTQEGILMQLPNASVSKAVRNGEREAAYVASMRNRNDDADTNRDIVKECQSRDQRTLALAHVERVVELDPKDGPAWSMLNYVFDSKTGEWIPKDLLNKRLGLVVFDGKRMTMHAAELARARKKIKDDGIAFKKELDRALKYMGENSKNGEAARIYLSELNDPRANPYLESLILASLTRRRDPHMFLEILLRMPKGSATEQLINIARATDDLSVVDPVLEELKSHERMRVRAMLAFVEDLKSKNGKPNIELTNRAGRNLEAIGDERIVLSLIDRLVTRVIETVKTPPVTSQQHGSGGVSHSTGGTRKEVTDYVQPGVLQALNTITGESFGYDSNAWRKWYALNYGNVNVETRRFDD